MEKRIVTLIVVIATFVLAIEGIDLLRTDLDRDSFSYLLITGGNRLFWMMVIPCLALLFLYPPKQVLLEIGLQSDFLKAVKISGIATLPMLLGYSFHSNFQIVFSLQDLFLGAIAAALGEEVLFRGFLFSQLHRRVGLWFVVAAGANAVLFGIGHLYQGNNLSESLGVFAITLLGGLWFSWLLVRWAYNLWVPIGFHFLMNLYWSLFSAGDNAIGGIEANLYRVVTIGLSIWLTILWAPSKTYQFRVEDD